MSKAPSMPMFWDAYLADTTHLTTEEHGAYMLLLGAMWRRNGWVPDDDRDIARILGLTMGRWRKIKPRLSTFLIFRGGEISQKKLLEIWENTQEKITKNRANGSKGGRPKSNKTKGLAKANGSVSDNPNETIPEPEPDKEKEIDKSISKKTRDPAPNPSAEIAGILEIHAPPAAVASFIAYRRRTKGKALTLTAAKRLAQHLRAIIEGGGDGGDALGMAEERGWLTVEPAWYFRTRDDHGKRNHNPGPAEGRENRPDPALEQIARLAGLSQTPGYGRC